jgi:hypothetical protein
MAQSGAVLNSSTHTGWKWAQREDAEWMFDDFITSEQSGKIWGLSKEELWEK